MKPVTIFRSRTWPLDWERQLEKFLKRFWVNVVSRDWAEVVIAIYPESGELSRLVKKYSTVIVIADTDDMETVEMLRPFPIHQTVLARYEHDLEAAAAQIAEILKRL